MTERPEGARDAATDEPEAPPTSETESPPTAETVTGAPEARAAAIEELETEAGAYPAETDDAEIDEIEAELEAEEAEPDELGEEIEEATVVPLGVEPAAPLTAATGAAVPRRRGTPAPVQRAPTQSELAVHVTDNASRFFVIGTVVVFVAIFAYALLAGSGGFFTTTPTPTAVPSASASASAGAS